MGGVIVSLILVVVSYLIVYYLIKTAINNSYVGMSAGETERQMARTAAGIRDEMKVLERKMNEMNEHLRTLVALKNEEVRGNNNDA